MNESLQDEQSQSGAGEYPAQYIHQDQMRDGTPVTIRPIRPEDAPELQKGFKQLSAETKYLRFLEVSKEMSDKQAREFATVDYQDRMALVAEAEYEGETRIVGVARYAVNKQDDRGLAEIAVVVGDPFQGRGLGTLLMRALGRFAMDHGVKGFLGTVSTSNLKIMNFIKKSGLPTHKSLLEPGTWEVQLELPNQETHE